MLRTVKILTLGALLAVATSASGEQFFGRVAQVQAGNYLTIKRHGHLEHIRIFGVECPRGTHSVNCREFTLQMAGNRGVHVRVIGKDENGRPLAQVGFIGGKDLAEELVRAGMARWAKRQAPHAKNLAQLEAEARSSRRGLWSTSMTARGKMELVTGTGKPFS